MFLALAAGTGKSRDWLLAPAAGTCPGRPGGSASATLSKRKTPWEWRRLTALRHSLDSVVVLSKLELCVLLEFVRFLVPPLVLDLELWYLRYPVQACDDFEVHGRGGELLLLAGATARCARIGAGTSAPGPQADHGRARLRSALTGGRRGGSGIGFGEGREARTDFSAPA